MAEPEANARPAFLKIGATACTSSLPAGPMTPMTDAFDASACAVVDAFDGSSCVSSWTSLILILCFLFHCVK